MDGAGHNIAHATRHGSRVRGWCRRLVRRKWTIALVFGVVLWLRALARRRKVLGERARQRPHERKGRGGLIEPPAPSWADALSLPSYEADMLLQWRVVTWAVRYAAAGVARRVAQALSLRGLDDLVRPDDIDDHVAKLQKRTNHRIVPSRLRALVGNTPLLAITFRFMGKKRVIYAKSEQYNMTGSIKDRMALHILDKAYATGALRAGDLIVEASSGNSGISFAAMGRALGHPVAIYMPDWMSAERKAMISGFGAQLVSVSALQGGFVGSIQRAYQQKAEHGYHRIFLPEQFSNADNAEAHELTTGPELLLQLAAVGVTPSAFVAGVGTGGTVMGVARAIRSVPGLAAKVKVHPMEPAESPTLSRGQHGGAHRIQGVSDEFVPPIVDLPALDGVIPVPDGDAIRMAQKLAADLGLGVGISSGANFLAALEAQERLGADAAVATIFCDDNKKYLSSALARPEPLKPGYRAQHVELLDFQVIPPLAAPELAAIRDGPGSWHARWLDLLLARDSSPAARKGRAKSGKGGAAMLWSPPGRSSACKAAGADGPPAPPDASRSRQLRKLRARDRREGGGCGEAGNGRGEEG